MKSEEQQTLAKPLSDSGFDWTQSPELYKHLKSLNLHEKGRSSLAFSVIPRILSAISDVAKALRTSHEVSLAGTANSFGDDQLNVDVVAENLIRASLAKCPAVRTASSEEDPIERAVEHDEVDHSADLQEKYTVAFDPLDGSSIIAPNWTVGTIVGIWDGTSALGQSPAEKQVAAVLGVFGPRTTAIVAIRTPENKSQPICFELGLGDDGIKTCEIGRPVVEFASGIVKTRYFAPANLRAAAEDERYMDLVNHYIRRKYTLRYSGGLVPDIVHALVKGHGIYLSPVTVTSKAKLRRLYELCPLALIVECAGGKAMDPADGKDILDAEIKDCNERGGLVCGTAKEVESAMKMLLGV